MEGAMKTRTVEILLVLLVIHYGFSGYRELHEFRRYVHHKLSGLPDGLFRE
jgi:hypothetical protein